MEGIWPHPVTRHFDAFETNTTLIHCFVDWQGPVYRGYLELHLAAGSIGDVSNDAVRLPLVGGGGSEHFVPVPNDDCESDRRLPGPLGARRRGNTCTRDLEDLPETAHGWPTDILVDLGDGELELAVDDDTAVDYAILYICHSPYQRRQLVGVGGQGGPQIGAA